jgi:hypothetical protein
MGELVTVARFETLGAAQAARMALEAEGIRALVFDRDALRLDPFRPEPLARIRLQVRPEDEPAAREVLERFGPRSV